MDPRINERALAVVEEPSAAYKYFTIAKAGFKKALSYELLAFLSMFGLAKMLVRNQSTWTIKLTHLAFLVLSYL